MPEVLEAARRRPTLESGTSDLDPGAGPGATPTNSSSSPNSLGHYAPFVEEPFDFALQIKLNIPAAAEKAGMS